MAVHIVKMGPVRISNATGSSMTVVGSGATIAQVIDSSKELRVLENPNVPSSAGNPTLEDYLIAEDAAGFQLRHLDNVYIITYDAAGSF